MIPLKIAPVDQEVFKLPHHPHPQTMFFYGSLLKWLYQIAFPAHKIPQVDVCEKSIPYDCHLTLLEGEFGGVDVMLDLDKVLDLIAIEGLGLFGQ